MRLAILLFALAVVPAMPTPAAPARPAPGAIEVIERDAAGRAIVARVALSHDLPGFAEGFMDLGGTWSYLLRDGAGVVVFDVGPRYPLAWSIVPWHGLKGRATRLPNNARIWQALDGVFPGRPITSIVLSHWHADHTEDAPALQHEAQARFGKRPPLRIAAADREARWRGAIAAGADHVFAAAGFPAESWHWGPDLTEGAAIGASGFVVLALPGHTRGTIALVHPQRKLSLGPPPAYHPPRTAFWTEAPDAFPTTIERFYRATEGYRRYSTHPGRE